MDEDDDLSAEEEAKLPPESESGEDDVKTAASRIAHKAIARVRGNQAAAAATPKEGEAPDPMAVAKAVMAMPLAKTHPALANATAFETGMTVDRARARLEAAEKDRKASATAKPQFSAPDTPVAPNSSVSQGSGKSAMVAAAEASAKKFNKT